MGIHFTCSSKEIFRRLSILDSRIVVSRLRLRLPTSQQSYYVSSRQTARPYTDWAEIQDRLKPTKPNVQTGSSPPGPHWASTTLQKVHPEFSCERVQSAFSFSTVSVPLLVFIAMVGIQSVWFLSARNLSFLSNVKCVDSKKPSNGC